MCLHRPVGGIPDPLRDDGGDRVAKADLLHAFHRSHPGEREEDHGGQEAVWIGHRVQRVKYSSFPISPLRSSLVILFFACLCLAAGCLSSGPAAEDVYERAEAAFQAGNYRTAEDLYGVARNLSRESGDADLALAAKRGVMRARYNHMEYPCNRAAAEAAMRERIPRDHRGGDRRVARYPGPAPVSDNETLYFG